MKRCWRTAVVALAIAWLPDAALAQPSIWERAKNPAARAEAKLAGTLERTLDEAEMSTLLGLGVNHRVARRAVATFELSGASEPVDPDLAILEARALVEADIGREADARRLLEGALARLPPGTRAAGAWNTLAMALARLDDPSAEEHAYTEVIELTWDSEARALAHYNRGEVEMRRRDLTGALADYESAVAHAQDPSVVALARYGLSVAEERLGDLPSAYTTLDRAALLRLPVPPFPAEDPLDLPGVFFVPAYEENYLRALRSMAEARRISDPTERHDTYEVAIAEWDLYLALSPESEPFRENARSHRARATRDRDRPPPPKH